MFAYLGARQRPVFLLVLILATHGIIVAAGQGRDDVVKPSQVYNISDGSVRRQSAKIVPLDTATMSAVELGINYVRDGLDPLTQDPVTLLEVAESMEIEKDPPSEAVQFVHEYQAHSFGVIREKHPGGQEFQVIALWGETGDDAVKGQLKLKGARTFVCCYMLVPSSSSGTNGTLGVDSYFTCLFDKAYGSAAMPRASVALLLAAVALTALLA